MTATAEVGITVLPLQAIHLFLRDAMRECLTCYDADYKGELLGQRTLSESELVPFTSRMTGFTVYRFVDLHDPVYARSKMVVKHYPGQPPIGPLPLPPTSKEAEVTVYPPPTSAVHPSLTPTATAKISQASPTPKAAAKAIHMLREAVDA